MMRRGLALMFSALVLATAAARGETGTAELPKDARQKLLAVRHVDQQYLLRGALAEYERLWARDPRWDAPVRDALALWLAPPDDAVAQESFPRLVALTDKALAAGCRDVLVRYLNARTKAEDPTLTYRERLELLREPIAELAKSHYPPVLALWADTNMVLRCKSPVGTMTEMLADAPLLARLSNGLASLPKVAQEYPAGGEGLRELVLRYYDVYCMMGNRDEAYGRVLAVADTVCGKSEMPLVIKALYNARSPKDKPGKDPMVTARQALAAAWEINPLSLQTALASLEFAADDAEMATWYGRAVALAPDDLSPRLIKAKWLLAREDKEGALKFARELVKEGDFRHRLPMVLVELHLAKGLRRGVEPGFDADYFADPDVFDDVKSVYEPLLAKYPGNIRDRTWYAVLASWCGKWKVADAQFRLLGEKADPSVTMGRPGYDYLRQKAAAKAAEKGEGKEGPRSNFRFQN